MTYSTIRCPKCHNVVQRRTNAILEIGNPFKQCPHCNSIYIDPFIREWETLSPFRRFFYFFSVRSVGLSFLIALLSGALVGNNTNHALASLFCLGVTFALLLIIIWAIHHAVAQESIEQSIKRTQNPEYVKKLKEAKLKIYPIKK